MLTQEQTRRVLQAIAECERFIAKEEPRNAALRPADVQKTLTFYKEHKQRLIDTLAAEGV